jgi:hypothetical protein
MLNLQLYPLLKVAYRIELLWLARLVLLIVVCGSDFLVRVNTLVVLLLVVVALLAVTTTVVLQKVLARTFAMVRWCHPNDFGSL